MANLKFKVGGVWNQIVTIKGDKGDAGDALPVGGVAGQLLIKNSATDNDATWQNNPTHDDRYYTESETDTLLAGKADTGHGHAIADVTGLQTALDGKSATTHTHDDRYYTETEMNGFLDAKADLSTEGSATLLASAWVGASAPYTYDLTVTGVTATSNQELLPSTAITLAQLDALQKANIVDAGQSTNTISLKAFKTKPLIDIPIRVILRGDK